MNTSRNINTLSALLKILAADFFINCKNTNFVTYLLSTNCVPYLLLRVPAMIQALPLSKTAKYYQML